MGTLGGHVLPGTFFIIFGIWWSFITAMRFINTTKKNQNKSYSKYRGSITMPCVCLPCHKLRRAPIESWIKLIFGTIGLLGEVITGIHYVTYDPNAKKSQHHMDMGSDHMNMDHSHEHAHHHKRDVAAAPVKKLGFETVNSQHIIMYTGFILGSIFEILEFHNFKMPKKAPYCLGVVAFGIEAFLFANHLHSRYPLDIHVHVLLVYAIYGCIFFSMLETYRPDQILFTYGRILFTILQGTWFWEVGFILYPPTDNPAFIWDKEDHNQIMLITGSFCWHVILIIVGLLLQLIFMKCFYRSTQRARSYFETLRDIDEMEQFDDDYKADRGKAGEGKYFSLISEDEEDVQFDSAKLFIKTPKDEIKLEAYKDDRENISASSSTSGNHSANLIL